MKPTKLEDVIARGPVHKTTQDESVRTACMIMSAANVGALPVVDLSGELIGMISERDVIRRCVIVNRPVEITTVKQVMTPNPQWLSPDAKPSEALEVMLKGKFRHLPVCSNGRVVGMVSIRDFQPQNSWITERLRSTFRTAPA